LEEELLASNLVGPTVARLRRQMGADGWLGIGWPPEYGGQGKSLLEQLIFFDEAARADAPVPVLAINSVAPTLMAFGTEAQKQEYLPRILSGEIMFCIGYTEPGAGTDLAALTTRADRDGDEYVINGQKIFTSLAHDADYVWLAARTAPSSSRHDGISIFIVPMNAPGVKVQPIDLLGGHNTNHTFYDGVRVPAENLVGEEHAGWQLIMNQLNHERITLSNPGVIERALDDVTTWAASQPIADGRTVLDLKWVQLNLARVAAGLEFLKLIAWKVAWASERDDLSVADASANKIWGSEFHLEATRLLMEILGEGGTLAAGSSGALLKGRLEFAYRTYLIVTFGGGTNEIQRDSIAKYGLGMPAQAR